ncbi:glycosyltransferase [Arthrobacter sp.]|uniref:glycosyltransferase n=1 Tax=Arthrobacter sp. TaxID=1667 RepID=UPI0036719063
MPSNASPADSLVPLIERRQRELREMTRRADGLLARGGRAGAGSPAAFAAYARPSANQWLLSGGSVDEYLDALAPELDALPPTSSGRVWAPSGHRVGIVADRFIYQSFDGLARLVPLTLENYAEHLGDIDVLLIVSTWRGLDDSSWSGVATAGTRRRRGLVEDLIPAYRRRGVPVVFYSKEDPPNYERFLPIARECDVILTSAVEKVEDYVRDCPRATRVAPLKFGVNPLHHSPIGSRPGRSDLVYFAGSWLPQKYPRRTAEGLALFDGILAAGRRLGIVDRHADLGGSDPRYAYPPELRSFTGRARGHAELMKLQRISDIAVNLNSVSESQTMFANRALELQASGTLVLSTYSKGINSDYPQVHIANSPMDVAGALDALSFEDLRRAQADGIRKVFSDDHAQLRMNDILRAAGFDVTADAPRIVALAPDADDALRSAMAAQSAGPVEVVDPDGLARLEADIVLPLSADLRYGVHYAKDMAAAFAYADADVVAKSMLPLAGADAVSHRFLGGGRQQLHATAWWTAGGGGGARSALVEALSGPATLDLDAVGRAGLTTYGLDAFGVGPAATTPPEAAHGAVPEAVPATAAVEAEPRPAGLTLSVIVPIYNNGDHLRHKAFASLLRCSVFGQMHVILVDDGSTDGSTPETIAELEARYPNVSSYRFPPGGSGSASRPRNKGLELTDTEFVTYLDPDDEMVEDGYAVMLEKLRSTDADFVVGDMVRWDDTRGVVRNVRRLKEVMPRKQGLLIPDAGTLARLQFNPISIEAVAARTEWLQGLGLEQPVGAVGQDTFFFQQMLFYARKVATVNKPVYAYYAAVSGSVVNVVSPRYFRKYLPLEEARAAWMEEVGLIEDYRRLRLEFFFKKWYLRKLAFVPTEDYDEAAAVVARLGRMYGDYDWQDPDVRAFWREMDDRAPRESAARV